MDKKYLNIETIKKDVLLSSKKVGIGFVLGLALIFAVIWVVCSLGSVNNFLWGAIVFVPVIGMLLVAYLVHKRRMDAIENLDFCIIEDICAQKEFISGDVNSDDCYILFFKKYGKYVEHHGRHYANIAVGDRCYLLRLGGSKKIYWASNKHAWDGLVGFEKREDVYYPQKTK